MLRCLVHFDIHKSDVQVNYVLLQNILKYHLPFNSDKCEVLRITRKRNPVIFPYKLHKKELNVTNAAKYLGVTISKDLNWTPHINNITGKAKNTLRFVKRS